MNNLQTNFHSPKNQTEGKTYHWFNERERLTRFYNERPFYGNVFAERFYKTIKLAMPGIIQASICGVIVAVVTYKQDAEKAAHLLSASFKKPIKQTECPYTAFVTTSLLNN